MDRWTGANGILRIIIVGYYITYECDRILEIATGFGLSVPCWLKGIDQNGDRDDDD